MAGNVSGSQRGAGYEDVRSDEAVKLAMDLIDVESLSGHEQPMAVVLKEWLEKRDWVVQLQEVEPQKSTVDGKVRHNLYARRPGIPATRTEGPRVLFNSHIDTVPPFFGAELCDVDGEMIIKGRGACDTKGILAAQLLALQALADEGVDDIGLLYVVSEETDHSGMIKANELGLEPRYMIVGEPTGSKMMRLQKGMLKVRLSCRGVACHSGYPHLGVSAIDPLVEVLHAIKHRAWPSSEELGETTVNIGLVEGGQAANALAEASEAIVMFRLIQEPEGVLDAVKAIAAEHDCAVEVISKNAPVSLEVLPDFEADVAAYNTDIAYFKLPKGRALLYGPGSIHHAHSRIEKIGVTELKDAVEAYKKIAKSCLGRPPL
ncbi:conserved unknown protein [Ectocarpus siliculosus]|uniref:Peptidase M20 dimerisation domain-containing protein n=1 Tax=Ectocarpus siliculosus TaxID=2880 RepID=D7FM78_ECTSI|nr:conserved unknown protein [Ectocarpus siliculosus]|eukprot:CBJ29901.1 conserved unknown protein [Ectocarpus siliculosus]